MNSHFKNQLKTNGILWMLLASFFMACMGALVKYSTTRLPASEVVFFRFLLNALFLIPWMAQQKISFLGHQQKWLFFRSFCGFVAGYLGFYVTSQIPLAEAYILNYSSPIFVAMLSAFFFKEKVPVLLYVYITLATLACILILKPGFQEFNPVAILGVLAALFSAFAYLGIKQLHKTDSFLTVVFHYSLFSTIASFLIFGREFILPTPIEAVALFACGACGTIGQLLMTYAYKHTDASRVSPYSYSIVLFTTLFGILFWGEIPDEYTFVGGIMMTLAGIGIIKLNQQLALINKLWKLVSGKKIGT